MIYQVWMRAEHDMCDSINGGHLFGVVEAESWEEACIAVMDPTDSYWKASDPTCYWGVDLCKSWEEALKYISRERYEGIKSLCLEQLAEHGA
jgi:hypothetical protein